jgi:hypothetical protein
MTAVQISTSIDVSKQKKIETRLKNDLDEGDELSHAILPLASAEREYRSMWWTNRLK